VLKHSLPLLSDLLVYERVQAVYRSSGIFLDDGVEKFLDEFCSAPEQP
jgi:hypothetical protein